MFHDSLKFAHKVLVTDDGLLITICRALIPEYSFLANQDAEQKKKFSNSVRQKNEFDNGLTLKVSHFNLAKEFNDSKRSGLLINLLYIVDCEKWFNKQIDNNPRKNIDNFFKTLQ